MIKGSKIFALYGKLCRQNLITDVHCIFKILSKAFKKIKSLIPGYISKE